VPSFTAVGQLGVAVAGSIVWSSSASCRIQTAARARVSEMIRGWSSGGRDRGEWCPARPRREHGPIGLGCRGVTRTRTGRRTVGQEAGTSRPVRWRAGMGPEGRCTCESLPFEIAVEVHEPSNTIAAPTETGWQIVPAE